MGTLRKTAKKSYGRRQRWDEDFKDEQFKIPSKPTRVRLGPEISAVPMHYVKFKNKEGKETGFYELCANWNYDTEEPEDRGCPMCELGIRSTTYSYGYLISRAEQAKGNLQVRPVRLTPKHTNDIVKLSDTAYEDGEAPDGWDEDELPEATDPKFGFDIMISVEDNNNKTEYKATVPIKKPLVQLSKEEYRAFKTYAQHVDYNELAKKAQSSIEAIQKKLASIGLLEGKAGVAVAAPSARRSARRPGRKRTTTRTMTRSRTTTRWTPHPRRSGRRRPLPRRRPSRSPQSGRTTAMMTRACPGTTKTNTGARLSSRTRPRMKTTLPTTTSTKTRTATSTSTTRTDPCWFS